MTGVRVLFLAYLAVIAAGILFCLVLGLAGR